MQVFGAQKQKGTENGTKEGELKTSRQHQTLPGHVMAVHGHAAEASQQFKVKHRRKCQDTDVHIKGQGRAKP